MPSLHQLVRLAGFKNQQESVAYSSPSSDSSFLVFFSRRTGRVVPLRAISGGGSGECCLVKDEGGAGGETDFGLEWGEASSSEESPPASASSSASRSASAMVNS